MAFRPAGVSWLSLLVMDSEPVSAVGKRHKWRGRSWIGASRKWGCLVAFASAAVQTGWGVTNTCRCFLGPHFHKMIRTNPDPNAVGYPPTAVSYPLSAIGWSCADFGHTIFFLNYKTPCLKLASPPLPRRLRCTLKPLPNPQPSNFPRKPRSALCLGVRLRRPWPLPFSGPSTDELCPEPVPGHRPCGGLRRAAARGVGRGVGPPRPPGASAGATVERVTANSMAVHWNIVRYDADGCFRAIVTAQQLVAERDAAFGEELHLRYAMRAFLGGGVAIGRTQACALFFSREGGGATVATGCQGNPCSTGVRWEVSPAAQMGCLCNRSGSPSGADQP